MKYDTELIKVETEKKTWTYSKAEMNLALFLMWLSGIVLGAILF